MRKVMRISAVAIAIVVAAALVPAQAADDVTVGQFIQQLARTQNLDATDAATAVGSLERVGIRVPSDLEYTNPLTEGDVASISRAAGLNVRAASPGRNFDSEQVNRFFMSFQTELSSRTVAKEEPGVNPPSSDNSQRGNGKKKGHGKGKGKGSRTPSEPE